MDWNKYLGQYPCYELDTDFRTFNDVAGCVALIPKQLDTPVLRKVRTFLEEYNQKPKYHGSNFEHNDEHIRLKDLFVGKTRNPDKPYAVTYSTEDLLQSIKHRIQWGLLDSPLNLVAGCNQRVKWVKIPLGETSYREEWADIESNVGKELCSVSKDMLLKARDLGDALNKEKWDYHSMVYSLKGHVHENWIKENAWDFTRDELEKIDIDKELGFKDDRTTS